MGDSTILLLSGSGAIVMSFFVAIVVFFVLKRMRKEDDGSSNSNSNSTNSGGGGGEGCAEGTWKPCMLTSFQVIEEDKYALVHKPGLLTDYKVNSDFVKNINVAAVINDGNLKFWEKYKYHEVTIRLKGKCGTFQIWDQCGGGDCARNARVGGANMLFDLDASAVERIWGLKDAQNFLQEKAEYMIGKKFDPKIAVKKYKLTSS